MKKSLLGLLLAVAMVVPAFATDKGAIEVGGKLGYLMSPIANVDSEGEKMGINFNSTFSLEVDAFYFVMQSFGVGVGAEYTFKSGMKGTDQIASGFKAGNTNLFAQAKYEFYLKDDKIFNNIYMLGKLGYGIINISADEFESELKNCFKDGLYWALGVGTTICNNFLFEVQYSCNYGSVKEDGKYSADLTYRTLQAKVGYKFII